MAFQLFKVNEDTSQNIVNDPQSNENEIQYNPILMQTNMNLEQVQLSNFEKSYGEEVLNETIPNATIKTQPQPVLEPPASSVNPTISTYTPNVVPSTENQSQIQNPIPNDRSFSTPNENLTPITEKPVTNKKRLFPLPNTTPIKPPPYTLPPAPSYKVETPNYQAVSSVSVPNQADFNPINTPPITTPMIINENPEPMIINENPEPKTLEEVEVSNTPVETTVFQPVKVQNTQETSSVLDGSVENILLVDENVEKTVKNNEATKSIFAQPERETKDYNLVSSNDDESKTINEMVTNLLYTPGTETNIEAEVPTEEEINTNIETTQSTDIKVDNFSNLSTDEILKISVEPVEEGFKRCPKCGQKMREDYKQCFVCGTYF